jgi:hypothetical protein
MAHVDGGIAIRVIFDVVDDPERIAKSPFFL